MRILVTGGAGFIGSHLVDSFLSLGHNVVVLDNFSTGSEQYIRSISVANARRLEFHKADLYSKEGLDQYFELIDMVVHLAANADVRYGPQHPTLDTEQNVIVTQNVLECMRIRGVKHIVFSSTGSVYGEATTFPTKENSEFPIQTSLYGASKLAAEALLTAYSHAFGFRVDIFRFVSILGPRYSHGHVKDFVEQLKRDPENLRVLGDGLQRKSYLHVSDCVSAIIRIVGIPTSATINIYNLGTDEYCTVNDSVGWITGYMGLKPKINYTGGDRGWVGDNPFIFLDTTKIVQTGWKPAFDIRSSVIDTVRYLLNT